MGRLHRNKYGFSLVETTAVLLIIALIGSVGFYVWRHHSLKARPGAEESSQSDTQSESECLDSSNKTASNDAAGIINDFQSLVCKNFNTVDSFLCMGLSGSCAALPEATVAVMPIAVYSPARKVTGSDFFTMPYLDNDNNYLVDFSTQNSKTTSKVWPLVTKKIATSYSTKTNQLQSDPEPDEAPSKTNITFYSSSSLCEASSDPIYLEDHKYAGDDISVSCAPMSDYPATADTLKPLFNAYVTARPQFANPQKSGKWLEFRPENTSAYPQAYIFDSNTPGYRIGLVDIVQPTADVDDQAAYFYEKGDTWHLISDNQENYAIDCNITFPNSDAHAAFLGQDCVDKDSNRGTIQ